MKSVALALGDDNISWWYPVDSKRINCAMLQSENKSVASAILDLGEQMKKMEQVLWDFCQNYAPISNLQSEVATRIDKFLTGVRNASNMGSAEKLQSSAPSPGVQPASGSLLPPSSLPSPPSLPPIYPHTPLPHTAMPLTPVEPTHSPTPPLPHTAGPIQPSTPPLPPPAAAPSFASVVWSGQVQPQSALAVQEGADFKVVDRKKMRKGTTERHESIQQALRGTEVNIDCRWAPTGITKL